MIRSILRSSSATKYNCRSRRRKDGFYHFYNYGDQSKRDMTIINPSSGQQRMTPHHLKDTLSILNPSYRSLVSPCFGAALEGSPLLGNLLRYGKSQPTPAPSHNNSTTTITTTTTTTRPSLQETKHNSTYSMRNTVPPASAHLATLLFFQPHLFAPTRVTRNKSMAAAHLTPALAGNLLGLAWKESLLIKASSSSSLQGKQYPQKKDHRGGDSKRFQQEQQQNLADLGIRSNYLNGEWTGVSLARWKALISLSALDQEVDDDTMTLVSLLWLRTLWEISSSKADILDFWCALENQVPGLSLFQDNELGQALRHDTTARAEWCQTTYSEDDLSPDQVKASMDVLMHGDISDDALWAKSLEIVSASLAKPSANKPIVPNTRYTFDGGKDVPDCVEVTVREVIELLMWDGSNFDPSRLPSTAHPELVDLFPSNLKDKHSDYEHGRRWFNLLSNLQSCHYISSSPNGTPYELTPTLSNVSLALQELLVGVKRELHNTENGSFWSRFLNVGVVDDDRWTRLEELKRIWPDLEVSSRRSTYRGAMSDEMCHYEIATLRTNRGGAIEIRQDPAHAISTVTHLRHAPIISPIDKGELKESLLNKCYESRDLSLRVLFFGLARDGDVLEMANHPEAQDTNTNSARQWLLLLATSFGPDRRNLGSALASSDLNRMSEVNRDAYLASCQTRLQAIECALRQDDKTNLTRWLLQETPVVSDEDAVEFTHIATNHEMQVMQLISEHGLDKEVLLFASNNKK